MPLPASTPPCDYRRNEEVESFVSLWNIDSAVLSGNLETRASVKVAVTVHTLAKVLAATGVDRASKRTDKCAP